jgi:hypothetical protein
MVSTNEFPRRFFIHVLPTGLVRIRHFGLFANRKRFASLLRCRSLLKVAALPPQPAPTAQIKCPLCSEPMLVVERITSRQLLTTPSTTQRPTASGTEQNPPVVTSQHLLPSRSCRAQAPLQARIAHSNPIGSHRIHRASGFLQTALSKLPRQTAQHS